jgi:hypothetical protein
LFPPLTGGFIVTLLRLLFLPITPKEFTTFYLLDLVTDSDPMKLAPPVLQKLYDYESLHEWSFVVSTELPFQSQFIFQRPFLFPTFGLWR